jgi:hypothetical protein
MKELKDIWRKDQSMDVKLKIATKVRDFTEIAKVTVKQASFDVSVEAFNNTRVGREPDRVGITMFYPSKNAPTHILCKIVDGSIKEDNFALEIAKMERELKRKI